MDFDQIRSLLAGRWQGQNLLRLSWQSPSEFISDTTLQVSTAAKGRFLTFSYDWEDKGERQEGLLVVGYHREKARVTGSWIDSWHMSAEIMFLTGELSADGTIRLQGSYEAPPGPDWGWRIEIIPESAAGMRIEMYNGDPDGGEELAVRAEYEKAPD